MKKLHLMPMTVQAVDAFRRIVDWVDALTSSFDMKMSCLSIGRGAETLPDPARRRFAIFPSRMCKKEPIWKDKSPLGDLGGEGCRSKGRVKLRLLILRSVLLPLDPNALDRYGGKIIL